MLTRPPPSPDRGDRLGRWVPGPHSGLLASFFTAVFWTSPDARTDQERTMPFDTEDDDQEDNDESPEQELPKGFRKALTKAEKRAADLETELQGERRARVFLEAGIPNTPKFSYFRDGYKGEMTPEAAKAAAVEAELLPPPEPDTPASEMAAHERLAQASAGASATDQKLQIGSEEYNRRIQAAQSSEEVMAIMDEAGSPHSGRPA